MTGRNHVCSQRRWAGTIAAAVITALLSPALMGGESALDCCDQSLVPVENWLLGYRERENRCEGFYDANVSSWDGLEIVGLTQGAFAFSRADNSLTLSCPLAADEAVHVRVVGIPLRMYYQMDAVIESGAALAWPLDEVVHQQYIQAEELGILAWQFAEQLGSNRVLVPVRAQAGFAESYEDDMIILWIRPSVDVELIQWRMSIADSDCSSMSDWLKLGNADCSAGRATRIEIPPHEAHTVCIEVAARSLDSGLWLWTDALVRVGGAES